MTNSADIAGYQFDSQLFHGNCLISGMVLARELSPAALDMDNEAVLDQHAGANGIDRSDENTFDSSEFPKVIFDSQVTADDVCGHCGDYLI